jgi:hypothetical protein
MTVLKNSIRSRSAILVIALTMLAPAAGAVELNGTRADLAWAPASGDVASYAVFVSRNGAAANEAEQSVSGTSASVLGNFGDVLVVQVAGLDANGVMGPLSNASEPVEFVDTPPGDEEPPPPGDEEPPPVGNGEPPPDPDEEPPPVTNQITPPVYYEDFEAYADGEDPVDWLDTGARNSLIEDPSLFETFELTDGSMAFGTRSSSSSIHSHLLAAGSEGWSGYEISGLWSIDNHNAGIGITLYSDFPNSSQYYRLRRSKALRTFALAPRADGEVVCVGKQNTHVDPIRDRWYRFRFQAQPEGNGVRLRASVWEDGTPAPAVWQVDCLDPNGSLGSGVPGLWSQNRGVKLWDDFAVNPIDANEDPVPPGDGSGALYAENFEDSHLATADSGSWSAYEVSGGMSISHQRAGIGVTLYSDYPNSDTYYALRRVGNSGVFYLASRAGQKIACQGSSGTDVLPTAGAWYLFRFRAEPEADATRLRARVWEEGTQEPGAWQIDCLDAAGTFQAGAPGVWSKGPGIKLWDDLEVRPVED